MNVNRIPAPLVPDHRFDLENCGTEYAGGLETEHLFRFSSEQLCYLNDALRMPTVMFTPERDRYNSIERLCIVLRRLVFPMRHIDMIQLFGRQTESLFRICLHTMS